MALLNNLPYSESQAASLYSSDICDLVSSLAKLNLSYRGIDKPGAKLLNDLHRRGCTVEQFRQYTSIALQKAKYKNSYRPQTKVAILIGNNAYQNLSKLATPSIDCDTLANSFRTLGFIVITIKNAGLIMLTNILEKIFKVIPENSYCVIFYAGHGFELCNNKYILCVDSPSSKLDYTDCLSDNYILKCASKCRPELCVLIMDMCRISLDRESNPALYDKLPHTEKCDLDGNLLMVYSTQSDTSAYEMVQLECSHTLSNVSYVFKTGDSGLLVGGTSQYVKSLCDHLEDNKTVSEMLDRVHEDLENAPRKQIPLKIQSGVAKRSLHDLTKGNVTNILNILKNILYSEEFKLYCQCY